MATRPNGIDAGDFWPSEALDLDSIMAFLEVFEIHFNLYAVFIDIIAP
jgi:hypothetical protein